MLRGACLLCKNSIPVGEVRPSPSPHPREGVPPPSCKPFTHLATLLGGGWETAAAEAYPSSSDCSLPPL